MRLTRYTGFFIAVFGILPCLLKAESFFYEKQNATPYLAVTFDNHWLINDDNKGALRSEIESYLGYEKQAIYINLEAEKPESEASEYIANAMYSFKVANVGLVLLGARYTKKTYEKIQGDVITITKTDLALGIQEFQTQFFDIEAYLFIREKYLMGSIEVEKEIEVIDNFIVKPYIEAAYIWRDKSQYASRDGLNEIGAGIETRFEINKYIESYLLIAYEYSKGNAGTFWQEPSGSNKTWLYGAGLRFQF